MMSAFDWVLAIAAIICTSLWAAPIISRQLHITDEAFFWSLSFGLSVGILTLGLAVVGFILLSRVVVGVALVSLAGSALWFGERGRLRNTLRAAWNLLQSQTPATWGFGLALLAVGLIVLAQATYYPFTGDDEISRYGYFARLIYENQQLTAEARGYPFLLPIAYAITFFAADGLPEQAARVFPVLFSAITVLATYALARRWLGSAAARTAALILAATPLFIFWAPVGYVDIPSALYMVLTTYAVDCWRESRSLRLAILTGFLAGLALWTKQAGFAALAVLGLIVAATAVAELRRGYPTRVLRIVGHGLLMLCVALVGGGWWYIRNAIYDGWGAAVPGPGTFYTQQALNDLAHLLPFIAYFRDFGYLLAPVYILGLTGACLALVCNRLPRPLLQTLLWSIPYTLLWWWLFSYDPRFLLTVLPYYAIAAGGVLAKLWTFVHPHLSRSSATVLLTSAALIASGSGIWQARPGGALLWLTEPTASYGERLARAKGDLYPAVAYLRDHAQAEARIYSMDGRLNYYLLDHDVTVGYPYTTEQLAGYDFFVVGSWARSVYRLLDWEDSDVLLDLEGGAGFEEVFAGPTHSLIIYRMENS